METLKTFKPAFGLFFVFITIVVLCATSCSSPNRLEKHCILKNKEYQHFVNQHELDRDIDEFLSN